MTDTIADLSLTDLGDFVNVENLDDKALVIEYDSRRHVVEPGATRPIPFEAANVYFGDPRSTGMIAAKRDSVGRVQFIPDRATEVRRLRTLYDNRSGDERVIENHPNVRVTDYDGNVIPTVLHDPAGDMVNVAVPTISENEQLREMMRRQQQTIDLLAQRLGVDPTSGRELAPSEIDTADDGITTHDAPVVDDSTVLPEDQ